MRESIMKFFTYEHLKGEPAEVSKPFCELAEYLHENLPSGAERATALRKLLEAKDCAVRAKL